MKQFSKSSPLRILVVEDNPGDFFLLKDSIGLADIEVTEIQHVDTLTAAIEYLQQNKPDIIFLDLYLPDSSGLESFDQLKKYSTGSAVIILSGLSDTQIALEAIALGAQDYLAKGEFDGKMLKKTIAYAIERRRSIETLKQANERYSLVTKATHDLIWDRDLVTDIVYRDEQAVKKVYGFSTNNLIQHLDGWNKHVHPDDADRLNKLIQEVKDSTDNDFFEVEYRLSGEGGVYKNIYDRGYVVRNAEGKAIRLIGAAQDITEKRRLEMDLEESRIRHQKAITEATIKGQENERKQLGIELHDNINQILATSKLYLDHALTSPVLDKDLIYKSKEFIILATQEIRKLSHALLPLSFEEFGLIQSLSDLIDSVSVAAGFKICKRWDSFREQALQKDQKLTIYRIVQEQLNNIIKHAEAKNVVISLCLINNSSDVQLLIRDDGKGFDTDKKRNGVGLQNIVSRVELFDGVVTIQSNPGEGCELKVVFPCTCTSAA
jgi:two-component system sensor histidine kinase UhpB